jgi:ribosome-associated translation inhibitor RaiA
MIVSISYKHVTEREPVEAEVARYSNKLEKLLKSYDPDLLKLHGVFARNLRTKEQSFSLNLILPTGTLHATGTAETLRTSCKQAFSELEAQVKKHRSLLRRDHEWKRKRPRAEKS